MQRARTHIGVHKKFAIVVACVLGLAACAGTSESADLQSATVRRVVDGDTVEIRIGGNTESVRLIGVNTPETKHPTKPVECFGPEASEFLHQLLPEGTKVRVERDVEARDRYGRLLLYVYSLPDNVFVNYELALQGYAEPLSIEPNTLHRSDFVRAASQARDNKLGLWKACR
jgi:micrococcal nuclease